MQEICHGLGGVRADDAAQEASLQGGGGQIGQELLAGLRQGGGEEEHRVPAGNGQILGLDGIYRRGQAGIGAGCHGGGVGSGAGKGGIAQRRHQSQASGQRGKYLPHLPWAGLRHLGGQLVQNILVQVGREGAVQAPQGGALLGQLLIQLGTGWAGAQVFFQLNALGRGELSVQCGAHPFQIFLMLHTVAPPLLRGLSLLD